MNSPSDVREILDVVVRDDAQAVRVDAGSAWQRGRRRRTRNRIGVAAAVLAVVGIGVVSIAVLDGRPTVIGPAAGEGDTATKHPLRLEHTYWDDDQPSVTGPLAGLVHRSNETMWGWYSVSPDGHLWHLDATDDYVPALSPGGSHLAYMRGDFEDAEFVITNQLDGTVTTFPQIGTGVINGSLDDDPRYFHSAQTPSFWSPAGSAVLVRVGRSDPSDGEADPAAAVLRPDGTFATVPEPAERGSHSVPVGWLDDDHVVFAGLQESEDKVRIWIVDVRTGDAVKDFSLETGDAHYNRTAQWFGSVSPGGKLLATSTTHDGKVRYFALQPPLEGRLYSTVPAVPFAADTCPLSWTSTDLHVPAVTDREGQSAVLVSANGGATVLADPRLDIVCSSWATTALEGPEDRSWGTRLFGDDTSWLSWHWREVALSSSALAVLLTGGIAAAVLRRRRRRRAA